MYRPLHSSPIKWQFSRGHIVYDCESMERDEMGMAGKKNSAIQLKRDEIRSQVNE